MPKTAKTKAILSVRLKRPRRRRSTSSSVAAASSARPVSPDLPPAIKLLHALKPNPPPPAPAFLPPTAHRSGKTGTPAEERCRTVRSIADPASVAGDFVRPGHVHPLLAKEGGVLRRA